MNNFLSRFSPVIFVCLLLTILIFSSCHAWFAKDETKKDLAPPQQREWLKQIALCDCLKHAFPKEDCIKNDVSFSILAEFTDFRQHNTYQLIDSLAKLAVKNIEPAQPADYEGKKPYMLGCIDFYHSKSLDSLIKVIEKRNRGSKK
ncbi:type VI secretion system amidase immunity protein Tai4 [Mucilaginibacter sp. RS28]|uniref:Type VI secretion system amidase immunity protein Tai4 n=1 Tax=Mucilaginibacter straminoryzae TaxID=2932774 RepID=A0A9X1X1B3_9SPHI|nr:T6SS amidase immunity protein Tai4 family protein [Mucilaginibacter straminoryzae]MCJ8208946.1 type VI secretion system amidase immunity protein Tai4 [Mucilaginibacter straminoryzae]